MTRALVLVDGEHYPPVILDALADLERRGYQIAAAVFLGGGEKLGGPLELGSVPVVDGPSQAAALDGAIVRFAPEIVIDLSDAPVLDTRARMLLASVAVSRGVPYQGADFRFDVPPRPRLTDLPTVAVVGTGKRTGKTAISGHLARVLASRGERVAIVAMGRGGPAHPVVVRGDVARPTPEELVEVARRGEHAASDSYEDAVTAGVATVGARRAGAGFAGAPFSDTVAAAVESAVRLGPDLIVLEGSGTAIPPAAADATILVAGGGTPAVEIAAGMGPYRLLLADLVVVTMAEEPILSDETLAALRTTVRELARDVPILRTVFRPVPIGSVAGKKTFFATTAPKAVADLLRAHLEDEHGAHLVGMTHRLGDRAGLAEDLRAAEGTYEVLLTELKAAAVDVAIREALEAGAEVVVADNVPVAATADLEAALGAVAALARDRARGRT